MENEAKPKKKEFNTCLLYLLIGLMLFTGSTNTIATKTQTKLKGLNILYEEHQWFITYGMFIGEMFSLIGYVVHMVQKCKKKNAVETIPSLRSITKEKKNLKLVTSFLRLLLCATTLNTFGSTYLSSSIYQMFRGFELLFIVLFSKIFLKSTIYRHHILAVGSVISGLFCVG